ncbi:MAG: hypothetical protein KF774_21240 [Planctomyces sp.]|nr:hypothetical protein [Planctomyces sp.]
MNRSSLLSRLLAISPRWRTVAVWASVLTAALQVEAFAQPGPDQMFSSAAPPDAFVLRPDASGAIADRGSYREDLGVGGMGVLGRFGHIAGDTVGRGQSITHFELMPYLFSGETMFYADGRLYAANNGRMGGTAGAGVRHYFLDYNSILGGGFFWDRDDTRGIGFEQIGVSIEYLSEWMDIRTNLYKNVGQDSAILGTSFVQGSERFEGDQIIFNTATRTAAATDGLDMLFSTPVPGAAARSVNLEASAGWYHFQARGQKLPQVWGWRMRLDADWFKSMLHTFVDFTSDDVFDHNIVFGAEVNYFHDIQRRPRIGHSQFNRMSEWVRRNYNVVAIDERIVNPPEAAINPLTGQPYIVLHVRNIIPPDPEFPNFPFPPADGTVDLPYDSIQLAQTDPAGGRDADIIFVHAGSVFNNAPIVLGENQQILGEGVIHPIAVTNAPNSRARPVDPLGTIRLPTVTGRSDVPQLINTAGPAVTLANGSTFAGFDIIDTTGTAIVANGVSGSTVRDVNILGTTGPDARGVDLTDVSGSYRFENVSISGAEGEALFIDGGNANIAWFGGTINNTSNHAVLIQNQFGGTINLAGDNGTNASTSFGGLTITDVGGEGILIQDTSAAISFGRSAQTPSTQHGITITDSQSAGMRIFNLMNPGSVNILRGMQITDSAEEGLDIDNVTGNFLLANDAGLGNDLIIRSENDGGIDLTNILSPAQIIFLGNTSLSDIDTGNAPTPAINFSDFSTGLVRFDGDINITGTNALFDTPSINISGANPNLAGAVFEANGNIFIANPSNGPGILVSNDPSTVRFGRLNSPSQINIVPQAGNGIVVLNNTGQVSFASSVNVATSQASAIVVQDNASQVAFGSVNVTDHIGPDAGVFVFENNGPTGNASVTFNQLNVNSTGALAVFAAENDSLTVNSGTVIADGAQAIDFENNDRLNATFTSVSSNGVPLGIRVVDDAFNANAAFRITGTSTLGSGGLMENELGSLFQNIQTVGVNLQDYIDNIVGIETLNVANVSITRSRFQSSVSDNYVRLLANVARTGTLEYNYVLDDNLFEDTALLGPNTAMVHVESLLGAGGSNLDLTITDSQDATNAIPGFVLDRLANSAAVRVDWSGNVVADVSRNVVEMGPGDDQFAFDIVQRGTTFQNNVLFRNNIVRGTSTGSDGQTGARMVFGGRTDISILNNSLIDPATGDVLPGFVFAGTDAIGYDLTFRTAGNNIVFDDNALDFNNAGGTGLLFRLINASNVTIGGDAGTIPNFGNSFELADIDFSIDQGIIFQTTLGTINLSGTQDNIILFNPNNTGSVIDFQAPANSTGTIIINGQPRP